MIPSMSRPANPYDNASCESFMKTLKREEIYANEYQDLEDLRGQHRGSSSTSTTIASGFTRRWATARPKSSNSKPNLSKGERLQQSGSLPEQRAILLQGCWEKGLKRRPFPRPHPCLENQRDDATEIGSRTGCRNLW